MTTLYVKSSQFIRNHDLSEIRLWSALTLILPGFYRTLRFPHVVTISPPKLIQAELSGKVHRWEFSEKHFALLFQPTDFIGKEALKKINEEGLTRKCVCLTVDTTDVDPEGDETVWHDGKVGSCQSKMIYILASANPEV